MRCPLRVKILRHNAIARLGASYSIDSPDVLARRAVEQRITLPLAHESGRAISLARASKPPRTPVSDTLL